MMAMLTGSEGVNGTMVELFHVASRDTGGRHAMALTVDGKVFSWGEGEDWKLGHPNLT